MGQDKATGEPELVVITDGLQNMNILHFDAKTGAIRSKEVIDFGMSG